MSENIPENTDRIWKRAEIASPCIKLCSVHPVEKICVGCYRTLNEIGNWSRMTPEERDRVMGELPARAPRLHQRRGGHSGRTSESA
ncbi:DUF1289 domain-containing protein [Sedimentimonas flavescens]|uniref:DUF1289 domain-containing protein n=1 Tax=Sedimentimonas flavescens TaxID=2851012 RepID=UPI001C49D7CC|nr:DUF1289 domain-containing protein [Sedimentimonas flavescens]MBW0157421.1 DUF1289 domain-containing protein [Sedimentimonas flavescens]